MKYIRKRVLLTLVSLIGGLSVEFASAQGVGMPQSERKFKDTEPPISKFYLQNVPVNPTAFYQQNVETMKLQSDSDSQEISLLQAKIKALESKIIELEAEIKKKNNKN